MHAASHSRSVSHINLLEYRTYVALLDNTWILLELLLVSLTWNLSHSANALLAEFVRGAEQEWSCGVLKDGGDNLVKKRGEMLIVERATSSMIVQGIIQ